MLNIVGRHSEIKNTLRPIQPTIMHIRSIGATLAPAIILLLSGCATMLNKGNQSLVINSSPAGATVYENGAEVGSTPYTYTYDKPDGGEVNIELRKEGLQPVTFSLKPQKMNAILFADAMLLGIPYIVDGKSNALYKFPKGEMAVNMYKATQTGLQQLDLPITILENSLGSKAKLGKIGSQSVTIDSKELGDLRYPQTATTSLTRGLSGSFLNPYIIRQGTAKGDEDAQRAKVVLRPVLKALDMQLEEKDNKAFGNVHMDMEWRFYSGIDKDSLLFTISKSTDSPIYASTKRDVFSEAVQDAARQLLDEDALYDRITAVHSAGLLRSKGADLKLPAPTPMVFTDRRSMIPALVKGVVTVETKSGHGSGFLITNDGYIMTNAHVVGTDAMVKVRFEMGFTLDGQVVKVNRDFDVALIKVAGNDLPALSMGNDDALQLGEELFAIGTPLDEKLGQSVSRGIMSGKRDIDGRKYIQTDVSINPGNSGGPLIDDEGKVVGIATLKVKATGVEGIGFGVPISTAMEMLNIEFIK